MSNERDDVEVSIGISAAKINKDVDAVFGGIEKRVKKSADVMDTALSRVSEGQGFKAYSKEMDRLAKRWDPVYAASKKYEASLKSLDRALAAGAIKQHTYDASLKELNMELERGGKSAARFGVALNQTGGMSGNFRSQMQNIGFQVGDFATQVGAGTSATQALGQQLPQLLGGFGVAGAAAGAVAAIVLPLASALYKTMTNAVSLEDELDQLSKTTDAYVSAARAAAMPVETLREKYGDLADEIAALNGQLETFTGLQARRGLDSSVSALTGKFGGFSRDDMVMQNPYQGFLKKTIAGALPLVAPVPMNSIAEFKNTILTIEESLDVSRDSAVDIAQALEGLDRASGSEGRLNALKQLNQALLDAPQSSKKAKEGVEALLKQTEAIKNSIESQKEAQQSDVEKNRIRVLKEYYQQEQRLVDLIKDRGVAEQEVFDAQKARDADRLSQAKTVLGNIDADIEALRDVKGQLAGMQTQVETLQGALSYLSVGDNGDLRASLQDMSEALQGAKALGQDLSDVQLKGLESQFEGVTTKATQLLQKVGLIKDDITGLKLPGSSEFAANYRARSGTDKGAGDAELVRAVVMVSKEIGIAAKDLLTAMSFETGGTLDPWQAGPTTQWGQHRGLIQWGAPQREQYGVTQASSITEQVEAAGRYLQDAGVKAGDGLLQIYAAINAGDARRIGASDAHNGGTSGTVMDKVQTQMDGHKARAEGLLSAYADVLKQGEAMEVSDKELASERQKMLDAEVKEIEALKAVRASYADLIRSQLGDTEIENQLIGKSVEEQARLRTAHMLTQEAKRRGIDLNEQMVGSEQTYAEAIKATSDAMADQVEAERAANEARSDAAELAEFMDQAQRKLEDGIIDSIVEGKKFTDVLGDMAKMFARAALEASLFGKGPLSGSFGTSGSGGLLGGLLDGVFGAIGGSASMVSFDGGGYTGSGLRTGGLDGKGGFPAVLHPNETVLDHTRGGSRQGGGGTFAPQTSIVIQGNADERTLSMMRSELDKRDRAFFANWQKANKEYNARIS